MDQKIDTNAEVRLTPDQLISLACLANVLQMNRVQVLGALIRHLRPGTLVSEATQEQIRQTTGLSLKTIQRCIKELRERGVLKQWRGKYEMKQCFYKLYLPVPETAFESHGQAKKGQPAKKQEVSTDSVGHNSEVQPPTSTAESSPKRSAEGSQQSGARMNDIPDGQKASYSDKIEAGEEHVAVGTQSACPAFTGNECLDPQVSALVDELEHGQWRNTTVEFLISEGLIPLPIASDTTFLIDRNGLFQFLRERNANS